MHPARRVLLVRRVVVPRGVQGHRRVVVRCQQRRVNPARLPHRVSRPRHPAVVGGVVTTGSPAIRVVCRVTVLHGSRTRTVTASSSRLVVGLHLLGGAPFVWCARTPCLRSGYGGIREIPRQRTPGASIPKIWAAVWISDSGLMGFLMLPVLTVGNCSGRRWGIDN